MPKTPRSAAADESESIDIALKKQAPSRSFEGSDDQPVDADTGESLFDDINPRIRTWGVDKKKAAKTPDTEDEDLDEEIDEELDQEDADEQESAEDEPAEESDEDSESEESDEDEPAEEEDEPPAREAQPSKAWSKRLAREKRLREESEANLADALKRIAAVEKTQQVNASESEYNSAKADLDDQIVEVRAKLKLAMENGSAEEQLTLTEELGDLKSELRSKKEKFESAKAAVAATKDAGASPIVARRVTAWLRKHPRYGTDKVFQGFVKAADRAVADDGFSAETEEYYEELDRRVKERYPEEYKGAKKKETEERKNPPVRSKHPSASFRRDNTVATKTKGGFKMRGSKVQLSDRQKQNMRNFGMDPTSTNDVREYVTNNLSN